MSDEHDAFGRPRRPEGTDPFGAPIEPGSQQEPESESPSGWAPPSAPPGDETVASWAPPVADVATGEPSGWWRRVGASVIDVVIISVIGAIVGAIIASATDASDDARTGVGLVLGLLLGSIYYGGLMSRQGEHNGQTLGKQAAGIRVVRLEGGAVTLGYALVREILVKTILFGYLAIFTLYIATLLNYLWPLWDARNQALHDKIVKSQVRRV